MIELDTQTIGTDAGEYTVTWYHDDSPSQPEDSGFVFALHGWERSAHDDRIDVEWRDRYAMPDDQVWRIVRNVLLAHGRNRQDSWGWELVSGAALVRWLKLKGFRGVTLVDRDYRPIEPSPDRRKRVYGVAWDVGGSTDEDTCLNNVRADLARWRAWAEGDAFGWVLTGPDGDEVEDGAIWGYYGFDAERDYTLSEATSLANADAAERVKRANRVGAGFVGII